MSVEEDRKEIRKRWLGVVDVGAELRLLRGEKGVTRFSSENQDIVVILDIRR